MRTFDQLQALLEVDQSARLSEHAAGLLCDQATRNGLSFSQGFDGNYSVAVAPLAPAPESDPLPDWYAPAVTRSVPKETPPHNPKYVGVLKEGGVELLYVGEEQIKAVVRTPAYSHLSIQGLRTSFNRVLDWCPADFTVGETDRGFPYNSRGPKGLKLSALPIAARAVSKDKGMVLNNVKYRPVYPSLEVAKEKFLDFCEAVLTPPEE